MRWLAWGRVGEQCSPQCRQQPPRQDPCQSTGWGHVPKAGAPGGPHRAGADGVPGGAQGVCTVVGPAGRATPEVAGGPTPSSQLCPGSPGADAGMVPGSAGDSGSFPELLLLCRFGSACPVTSAEEVTLLGQPLGAWGYPGKGSSPPGTRAHRAQEPTGTVHTRTQGWDRQIPVPTHLQAPSRTEGCPQQPGVQVPARGSTGHWHPAVPRAGSVPSSHAFHHRFPG